MDLKYSDDDRPIGRAKRDIKEGEVLTVYIYGGNYKHCDAIEFFKPIEPSPTQPCQFCEYITPQNLGGRYCFNCGRDLQEPIT